MTRLETICSLIKPCGVFADIGCDHGIVSHFVAKNRLAERVCACDVSGDCLDKAKSILSNFDNAEFYEGDGFSPLEKANVTPDQAVICGMGGELIIKILGKRHCNPDLIVGGQKNADKLRVFLCEIGYKIVKDVKIAEKGKYYDVIRAEFDGTKREIDLFESRFGLFYKEKNSDLLSYFELMEKKLSGYVQTEKNVEMLKSIAEAKKWQL